MVEHKVRNMSSTTRWQRLVDESNAFFSFGIKDG